LQVYQDDLPELSPSELMNELFRASHLAAHDPRAIVWRGMEPMSARQWADERIRAIWHELAALTAPRSKGTVRAWGR
jgi:hypothetical protein